VEGVGTEYSNIYSDRTWCRYFDWSFYINIAAIIGTDTTDIELELKAKGKV